MAGDVEPMFEPTPDTAIRREVPSDRFADSRIMQPKPFLRRCTTFFLGFLGTLLHMLVNYFEMNLADFPLQSFHHGLPK